MYRVVSIKVDGKMTDLIQELTDFAKHYISYRNISSPDDMCLRVNMCPRSHKEDNGASNNDLYSASEDMDDAEPVIERHESVDIDDISKLCQSDAETVIQSSHNTNDDLQRDNNEVWGIPQYQRNNVIRRMLRELILKYPLILGTNMGKIKSRLQQVKKDSRLLELISWNDVVYIIRRNDDEFKKWSEKLKSRNSKKIIRLESLENEVSHSKKNKSKKLTGKHELIDYSKNGKKKRTFRDQIIDDDTNDLLLIDDTATDTFILRSKDEVSFENVLSTNLTSYAPVLYKSFQLPAISSVSRFSSNLYDDRSNEREKNVINCNSTITEDEKISPLRAFESLQLLSDSELFDSLRVIRPTKPQFVTTKTRSKNKVSSKKIKLVLRNRITSDRIGDLDQDLRFLSDDPTILGTNDTTTESNNFL
jgi:hypothetical protein